MSQIIFPVFDRPVDLPSGDTTGEFMAAEHDELLGSSSEWFDCQNARFRLEIR